MKKPILCFSVFLLLTTTTVKAQSVTGMPGYIRIPAASFNPDGTLYFGSSFLPKKYSSYTKEEYDAVTFYSSLTFLPFVEIDFRATRLLGLQRYTVDRMPSIRVRLLKEQKYLPCIVAGAHDFITTSDNSTARNYGATYLVMTKGFNFTALPLYIEITAGYGTNWLHSTRNEFTGLWGGISIRLDRLHFASFVLEYDGETSNSGLQLVFFKHLYLTAGLLNFDSFTGSISYHISLTRQSPGKQ